MKKNIIRFKLEDNKKRVEFLKNKKYQQLCVSIDGNSLYYYYKILS